MQVVVALGMGSCQETNRGIFHLDYSGPAVDSRKRSRAGQEHESVDFDETA